MDQLTCYINSIGIQDHLCHVNGLDVNYCMKYVTSPAAPSSLQTLNEISSIMETENLTIPKTVSDALNLYLLLINELC